MGPLNALLVHDHPEPFESLKQTLRSLSVEVYSVGTCRDAVNRITQTNPHLVFTECALRDGSWVSFLDLAEVANEPFNVIVVGAIPNIELYVSVMERGAFDYVAPPFEQERISSVLRSAELDARRRRETRALTAGTRWFT